MGILIFSGGCRTVSQDGNTQDNHCNTCTRHGVCEMEPRVRQLSELMSEQWVSTAEEPPPDMGLILFLVFPSDEEAGTVRCGYYDEEASVYREWPTGHAFAWETVIGWMLVPEVPASLYRNRASSLRHL